MIELFDYQKDGVEFIRNKKKVYIAFDMGMGKTITAIAGHSDIHSKNILIIAEKNEIVNSQNFKKEIDNNYSGKFKYVSLRDIDIEDIPRNGFICGINPDALTKISIEKIKEHFGSIIIDEATMAKTTSTVRFKKIKKVCDEIEYLTLLSGTPMMNGASEIYAPLYLMNHWLSGDGSKKSRQTFEKIFAGGFLKQIRHTGIWWQDWQWWAKGANNVRELRWLIDKNFFFKSKDQTNVFKKKHRIVNEIYMCDEWKKESDNAWDEYLSKVENHNKRSSMEERKSIKNIKDLQNIIENGQVYQVNSKWKVKEIIKDIVSKKYGDRRIIIWSIFIETDRIIQEELTKNGIEFDTFDNLKEWKKGNKQVLIGRIKSHAKGGNVSEANVCLFCDMDYVPTMNLQAENRIDRPEQKHDMDIVYYLASKDEIDTHVQKINYDKMRKIENFVRPFTDEEVKLMPQKISDLFSKYKKEFEYLAKANGIDDVKVFLDKQVKIKLWTTR